MFIFRLFHFSSFSLFFSPFSLWKEIKSGKEKRTCPDEEFDSFLWEFDFLYILSAARCVLHATCKFQKDRRDTQTYLLNLTPNYRINNIVVYHRFNNDLNEQQSLPSPPSSPVTEVTINIKRLCISRYNCGRKPSKLIVLYYRKHLHD